MLWHGFIWFRCIFLVLCSASSRITRGYSILVWSLINITSSSREELLLSFLIKSWIILSGSFRAITLLKSFYMAHVRAWRGKGLSYNFSSCSLVRAIMNSVNSPILVFLIRQYIHSLPPQDRHNILQVVSGL